MQIKNIIAGSMFIIFSLIFLNNMSKLPFGTLSEIGPGFFPAVVAACLFVIGIIVMFRKTDD